MKIEQAIDVIAGEMMPMTDRQIQAIDMAVQALRLLRWVPVSERHPEGDTPVLGVCTAKTEGGEDWLDRDICVVTYEDLLDEWTVLDDVDCQPVEVSHWMPLPEPPAEDE